MILLYLSVFSCPSFLWDNINNRLAGTGLRYDNDTEDYLTLFEGELTLKCKTSMYINNNTCIFSMLLKFLKKGCNGVPSGIVSKPSSSIDGKVGTQLPHTNVQRAAWAQLVLKCKTIRSVGTCRHKQKKKILPDVRRTANGRKFLVATKYPKKDSAAKCWHFPCKKDSWLHGPVCFLSWYLGSGMMIFLEMHIYHEQLADRTHSQWKTCLC